MLGPVLERYVAQAARAEDSGTRTTSPSGERTDVALTDEQRELSRKLMRSIRSAQPQPDLPSRLTARVGAINGPDQGPGGM
jgi:hypothetical protein